MNGVKIEKIAKELCEKSGCHHKCNDTKDCVVEDEAELLISNNSELLISNNLQYIQCIDCIHNEICQFYKVMGAMVICHPCGFYEANAGYRKQSEWISVEDRLPEKNGEVLVYNGKAVYIKMFMYPNEFTTFKKEPNFCYCDKSGDVWWIKSTDKITHWMPLPEAPKMKGGE